MYIAQYILFTIVRYAQSQFFANWGKGNPKLALKKKVS